MTRSAMLLSVSYSSDERPAARGDGDESGELLAAEIRQGEIKTHGYVQVLE